MVKRTSRRNQGRYDWIVTQLESQSGRLDARSRASQLANSSFDSGPGNGIDEIDPVTGLPVASYGTQYDGSHGSVVFTGPIPPRPSAPLVRSGPGTATIGWDGVFVNAEGVRDFTVVPTLDMTHVEVHVSTDPAFTAEFAETLVGTINTVRGGWCPVVTGAGTFYARLVARSSSGKKSPASAPVSVTVEGVNVDELREEWEAGDNALGNALTQTNQAQSELTAKLTGLRAALDVPDLQTITGQQIAARVGLFLELGVDKLTAGSANIGTAVADKLFSNIFSTRKLTADQVLIGQGGNMIVDADFTDATAMQQRLANLNAGVPLAGRTVWIAVGAAGADPNGLRTVSTANGTLTYADVFWAGSTLVPMFASAMQVKAGERFSLFSWVSTSQVSAVAWQMQTYNVDVPGTVVTTTLPSTVQSGLTNGKRWVRADYTVPATGVTAVYPRLLFTNQVTGSNTITVWGGAAMRKLDQEALALFGDAVYSSIPYDFRVTIGGRPTQTGGQPTPGMRFSYRKKDMSDVPPGHDAGILATAPTGTGVGAQMQSSAVAETVNSPFSRMWTDPAAAGMETRQGAGGARFLLETTPTTFNLRNVDGLNDQAAVRTDGDGVLDLYGKEGITLTGSSNVKPISSVGTWLHSGPATLTGAVTVNGALTPVGNVNLANAPLKGVASSDGTWTHNGDLTVSNNLTVASIATTSPQTRAAAFTWTRSIPNASAADLSNGLGNNLLNDAAGSNIASGLLVSLTGLTGGQMSVVQSGVFTVTLTASIGTAVSGRTFLQIGEAGVSGQVRSNVVVGEDTGSVSVTRFYSAGTVITYGVFQTSGAARTVSGRVIVVRHP